MFGITNTKPRELEVPPVPVKVKNAPSTKEKGIDDRPKVTSLPGRRVSDPDYDGGDILQSIDGNYTLITHDELCELIPVIRKLSQRNPDVSQALHNIVSLGNTGHKVYFDRKVPEAMVDKMRNHLSNRRKKWAPGQAGMDGLVNKFFSQVIIGGALSAEAIISPNMQGIKMVALINPERIVFKLRNDRITYEPHQKLKNNLLLNRPRIDGDLIKLNTETYQYLALNGDSESPYGIPLYAPVLDPISTQKRMSGNIDHIVQTMGLIGFLEVLISKPEIEGDEDEGKYQERLQSLLDKARHNIMGGIAEGVVSGYKDDHEFKFNSAAKNFEGVSELFKTNEMQVASALKQDASLWGRDYGTSEAKANITFIKMLSELRNIQNIVKTYLEWLYALELRLAGFNFEFLNVQFNRSTLQDDYKWQQAEELKIKNVIQKLILGVISLDQAADELGYETPFSKKPLVPIELLAGKAPKEPGNNSSTKRKAQKSKSAKKGRATKKRVTKDYK